MPVVLSHVMNDPYLKLLGGLEIVSAYFCNLPFLPLFSFVTFSSDSYFKFCSPSVLFPLLFSMPLAACHLRFVFFLEIIDVFAKPIREMKTKPQKK